jgi:hypothetical protein
MFANGNGKDITTFLPPDPPKTTALCEAKAQRNTQARSA